MSAKISDDNHIPSMIEECIHFHKTKGRDTGFFESLQVWYEEKGWLTEKQYESLCNNYDEAIL